MPKFHKRRIARNRVYTIQVLSLKDEWVDFHECLDQETATDYMDAMESVSPGQCRVIESITTQYVLRYIIPEGAKSGD